MLANLKQIVIKLDNQGRCLYLNQAWQTVLGYPVAQCLGQKLSAYTLADDQQSLQDLFTQLNQHKINTIKHTACFQLQNNNTCYLELLADPITDENGQISEIVGILYDVSADVHDKDWQKTLCEKNLLLLRHASDGIHILDDQGNIIDVSDSFCQMLGYQRGEMLGMNVRDWDAKFSADQLKQVISEQFQLRELRQFETIHKLKNGDLVNVEIRSMALDLAGKPILYNSSRDISHRKKTEAELKQAKNIAENIASSKAEFLALMSHEIRTPMNAIIGLSQLALNKPMSDEIRDYLEKINVSADSLLRILNDILDFSKLEAGKLEIEHLPFNLTKLVKDLYQLYQVKAKEKQLTLSITLSQALPSLLVGDAMRIQQILANLISNAIKFTETGSITVEISLLEKTATEAFIHVSVKDTGIGMSMAEQTQLFQPYNQLHTSITRRFGGSGLGLMISRQLLTLMDSDFQVRSEKQQGTCFSFNLALGIVSQEQAANQLPLLKSVDKGVLSNKIQKLGSSLVGKRILIAEDNKINQQIVTEFLTLSGVLVTVAENGRVVLNLLETDQFDAILMDIQMPEMSGLEATKYIRAQQCFDTLPIIALTAGVTQEEIADCLTVGMDEFIKKPINPEALISVLIKTIKRFQINALPTATEEHLSLNQLKGFDFTDILEMAGGDETFVKSMLKMFIEDNNQFLQELNTNLNNRDFKSAEHLVHNFKGTAGFMGAMVLEHLADVFETTLKQNQLDTLAFKAFTDELQLTLQQLHKIDL